MTDKNQPAAAPEMVTKLTLKTMGLDGSLAKALKQKVALARVIGIARNIKSAVGNNGDPVFGLTGQFEGTNLHDKKVFKSAVCYLPSGLLELVMDPLEAILNGDDRTAKAQGISFAMDIFAVPDGNKSGYTFTAEIVGDAVQADPLAVLKESLTSKALPSVPKLPTPEKA